MAQIMEKSGAHGFDARKGEFADLVKSGIVDAAKMARVALESAASIAGLMLTTEVLVTDLKEGDEKLAHDVITRDGEVDRLNWLVARQYNLLLRDIRLAETMNTTRERATNYLLIARIIERIGDHGSRMHSLANRVGQKTKFVNISALIESNTLFYGNPLTCQKNSTSSGRTRRHWDCLLDGHYCMTSMSLEVF